VLRAAAEVVEDNNGDWPGNDLVGERMGGVDAGVVKDALRALQDSGYLRLDGAFTGSGGDRVFVELITAKGLRALGKGE
jgi:hypothetical protein